MRYKKGSVLTKKIDRIIDLIDKGKNDLALKKIETFLNETNFERNYITFLKGHVLGRIGKPKKSISIFNNLLKKDLKRDIRVMVLISKGETLISSGNFKQSILALNKALSLSPNDHSALEYKARAQMGLKKFDDALESFKKSRLQDPNCIPAIANMGICYLHKKNYKKALELFKKVYKKDPSDTQALTLIFRVYYFKKDFLNAEKVINKILKTEKTFSSYAYKADVSAALKDYKTALIYYKKSLAHFKKCPHCGKFPKNSIKLIINYSKTLLKVRDYNLALKVINKGLKIERSNVILKNLKKKIGKAMK